MHGGARREHRRHSLALEAGWHAANFSRGKHLRDLDHYLRKLDRPIESPADEAASIFASWADRGLVTIREVERKD